MKPESLITPKTMVRHSAELLSSKIIQVIKEHNVLLCPTKFTNLKKVQNFVYDPITAGITITLHFHNSNQKASS